MVVEIELAINETVWLCYMLDHPIAEELPTLQLQRLLTRWGSPQRLLLGEVTDFRSLENNHHTYSVHTSVVRRIGPSAERNVGKVRRARHLRSPTFTGVMPQHKTTPQMPHDLSDGS